MAFIKVYGTGLDQIIQKLTIASETQRTAAQDALLEQGDATVTALGIAAPKSGVSTSTPIAGDSPGPLAQSFKSTLIEAMAVEVRTTQPTKFTYVTRGTGVYGPRGIRITPRIRKALMWQQAAHPWRSVAGEPKNPFHLPVLRAAQSEAVTRVRAALRAVYNL